MAPLLPIALVLVLGFLSGVLINLLADYLPARRHYRLLVSSPFATRSMTIQPPAFLPRRTDGRPWSFPFWSGTVAAVTGAPVFDGRRRLRRLAVEIGLALVFAWLGWLHAESRSLPFFWFYAAVFALVVAIDVEHRWILFETIWPPALVALAEAAFQPRVSLSEALQGGLYGFVVLYALYVFGFVFARIMGMVTRQRVGRTVLGFGDVRMATLSGLILGPVALGPALLIMIFTGGAAAALLIGSNFVSKRRYRLFAAIPYGPHVVIGTAVMLYTPWVGADLLIRLLFGR